MHTIHKLPESLIAQIAAGEVIERPAYAVKELIDNALDAEASTISIELEDHGFTRITVSDNGVGMSPEDLAESYKLHTTSKVSHQDMLSCIQTRGFRGEALASIAAVSSLVLSSRTSTMAVGKQIELENGEPVKDASVGMPVGTIIRIQNIFGRTPARKTFLRSPATELRHVITVVTEQAIARPDVRFQLRHGDSIIFDLVQSDTLERIRSLFGNHIAAGLIPVNSDELFVSVSGFISLPQISKNTSVKQYMSVNQRPIRDLNLSKAAKRAYGILLESNAYPYVFLNLTIPREQIDVNVHPRKEHVGFSRQSAVIDAITTTISQVLSSYNLTFRPLGSRHDERYTDMALAERNPTRSVAGKLLKEQVLPWNNSLLGVSQKAADIVQLHKTYLVTQTKQGILLIDQHAAHERILFEKYKLEFKTKINPTLLPSPVPIVLTSEERHVIAEQQSVLLALGFAVSVSPTGDYLITAAPKILHDRDISTIIREVLSDVLNDNPIYGIDTKSHKMLAYLACRTAVKAGDILTKQQAKDILQELEKIPGAYTCPHGRPVKFEMPLTEVHKLFRRIK